MWGNFVLKIFSKGRRYTPTAGAFPNINAEAIARQLDIAKRGRNRGAQNQPQADQDALDAAELAAIDEIDRLRREGIQNFEDHRTTYRERFARVTDLRRNIELTIQNGAGDFLAEIKFVEQALHAPACRVAANYRGLISFRREQGIDRPPYDTPNALLKLVGFCAIVVLAESVLNAQLLAESNEFGLLGGILLAALIAIVNVVTSSFLGGFARLKNHRSWFWRIFGIALILILLALVAFLYNLSVAHFRDAMANASGLEAAATASIETLKADPFGLLSMKSWLLFVFGALMSIVSAIKAYYAFDPYFGYGRASAALDDARKAYADICDASLARLSDLRNEAVDELKTLQVEYREKTHEAIESAEGMAGLKGHLATFLAQCDTAANLLLAIYRDANRESRTTPCPPHFAKSHRFPPYTPAAFSGTDQDTEEGRIAADSQIDAAIADFGRRFEAAVQSFRSLESFEDGHAKDPQRTSVAADKAINPKFALVDGGHA